MAFPLRLDRGVLRRCGRDDALEALLGIMLRTPRGTWAAAEHFGVRDLLEGSRTRPDFLLRAVEEINDAFVDLGLDEYRVVEIRREPGSSEGEFVLAVRESGQKATRPLAIDL